MNSLQSWALSVCVTMVGVGIFSLLVPNSNLKKVVSFTISLFFLSSLLSPLILSMPELDFSAISGEITQNTELEETTRQQVLEQTKDTIAKELGQIFLQNGYKIEALAIDISNEDSENDTDTKIKVKLTLPKEQKNQEGNIRALVRSSVGVNPEIEYSG